MNLYLAGIQYISIQRTLVLPFPSLPACPPFSLQTEHAGEVVRFLAEEGDLIGYGDRIVAIRPNFPGIKQL